MEKSSWRRPHHSKSRKVTEKQHLKLLCKLKGNNICRLSVQPIIPPHTRAYVSDEKNKKKGLVTVQTFSRGHEIWIQFDIQVNICFCRKHSGQM